jgi:transposase-like protein
MGQRSARSAAPENYELKLLEGPVPKWVREAIDLLAEGYTQERAAEQVGKSRQFLSKMLRRPSVVQY